MRTSGSVGVSAAGVLVSSFVRSGLECEVEVEVVVGLVGDGERELGCEDMVASYGLFMVVVLWVVIPSYTACSARSIWVSATPL